MWIGVLLVMDTWFLICLLAWFSLLVDSSSISTQDSAGIKPWMINLLRRAVHQICGKL